LPSSCHSEKMLWNPSIAKMLVHILVLTNYRPQTTLGSFSCKNWAISPKYSMAGLRTLHLPFAPVFHCKWTFYALFSLSIEGKLWGYKQKRLLKLSSIGTKWSSTLSIVWLKQPSSKLGYTISCSVCMATHLLILDHTCQLTVVLIRYHGLLIEWLWAHVHEQAPLHTLSSKGAACVQFFFPHIPSHVSEPK